MERSGKQYVLDTNVLIHDPKSIFAFAEHDVVVPIYCIEEFDQFKKEQTERGRNARETGRIIDALREKGSIKTGVDLPGGGKFRVVFVEQKLPDGTYAPQRDMDLKILAVALEAQRQKPEFETIFVTMDTNLRIRGDAFGIKTEVYENASVDSDELYSGWRELKVPTEAIEEFYANKSIQLPLSVQCFPNEFLLLVDEQNERHTALARHKQGRAIALKVSKNKPIWGLTARNMEQLFALELLMDDDIKLVTLSGHAGTGKSVISLAAGLSKVTDDSSYGKMIIARPVIPLKNSDIGFLPGTIEEKMEPWIKPLKDGIEFLMRLSSQDKRNGRSADELFDQGFVEIVPLAYVRGRSIPNEFFLIDECFPGDVTVTTDVGPMSFSALHDMWSAGAKLPMALSYNEDTGGHEYKQILNAPCKGEKSTIVVTTTVGTFECTQNHRFLTKRGWISAGDLTSSDLLLSTEGMISREFCAKFVSSVPGRDNVSVFDIEVEDNHNFVLSETTVVAHNCQNCSPHEIKTIVTRAGDGTKVVLTGDPAQIDAPYLDEHTNGLVYVVDRFKDSPLAGHIKLSKGERSELAEQAAKRL